MSLGIDIGGTNTILGLVDGAGEVIAREALRTRDYPDFEGFIEALCAAIEAVTAGHEVRGIGIGAPNANFHTGTIDHAPNLPWKGVLPLRERVQARFPEARVALTNDAKAAALGEMRFGAARGMSDFVLITLGTGLGCGMVAGGALVYGHDGMAGELGHTIVRREGRLCGCGRRGCLETYASASGIVRTMREWGSEVDSAAQIAAAALRGERLAMEAFEFTGQLLGEALAGVAGLMSPEAIILGGGLAQAGELLFGPVRNHLEINLLAHQKGRIALLPSALFDRNAAVLGAACLVENALRAGNKGNRKQETENRELGLSWV